MKDLGLQPLDIETMTAEEAEDAARSMLYEWETDIPYDTQRVSPRYVSYRTMIFVAVGK